MSLQPKEITLVPEETVRVARAAFPKGNVWLSLRDELGTIYSDEMFAGLYPSRGQVLAVGNHYQGKGETVALERNNAQQRHWTAALRRRSIVVSKSLTMIERRVALFAHLHINKDAAPEMYRLPIQTGCFLTLT